MLDRLALYFPVAGEGSIQRADPSLIFLPGQVAMAWWQLPYGHLDPPRATTSPLAPIDFLDSSFSPSSIGTGAAENALDRAVVVGFTKSSVTNHVQYEGSDICLGCGVIILVCCCEA